MARKSRTIRSQDYYASRSIFKNIERLKNLTERFTRWISQSGKSNPAILPITTGALFPRSRRHVKLSTSNNRRIPSGRGRGEGALSLAHGMCAPSFRNELGSSITVARQRNDTTRRALVRSSDRELIPAEYAASNCSPLFESSNRAVPILEPT